MSEPAELRVSDALDKLIHQFSDPLSFFREVIQNLQFLVGQSGLLDQLA